jgi:uncharacterized cupin superfamily protein
VETFNLFASNEDWDSEHDRAGYRHKVTAFGVSGRSTLRSLDGEQKLEPGDVAVFPEGPAGAHQVTNSTEEPVRIVFFSSKSSLAIMHYPDSGKVGLWSQGEGYQAMLRDEPKLDYWEGEA